MMMKYLLIIWVTILQVSSHSVDQRSVDMGKMFDHMLRLQGTVSKLSTKFEHTESEVAALNRKLMSAKLTIDMMNTTILSSKTENRKLASRVDKLTEELATKSSQINNLTRLADGMAGSVSFEVRQKAHPLTVGIGAVLKFDDMTLNKGGAYNPNSGIFIAPVTGTYIFWANIMSYDTGYFTVRLYLENIEEVKGYTSRVITHGTASLMYIQKVRKGQHVWFDSNHSGKIYGNNFSSYGGTLITTT